MGRMQFDACLLMLPVYGGQQELTPEFMFPMNREKHTQVKTELGTRGKGLKS